MKSGFAAQCLIEKTALFKLAHDAVVYQALERDIADFWIALLHKTLNVLQSIEYDKSSFVGSSDIILIAIIGRHGIIDSQFFCHDVHDRLSVRGIEHKAVSLDERAERASDKRLMASQIIRLQDDTRSDQRN